MAPLPLPLILPVIRTLQMLDLQALAAVAPAVAAAAVARALAVHC